MDEPPHTFIIEYINYGNDGTELESHARKRSAPAVSQH
jgi:hypothetical protein